MAPPSLRFAVVRRENAIVKHMQTVPVDFVKRYLYSPGPVQYYSDRRSISSLFKRIGTGWGLFSSDNNLEEGDVCVFELITKEENNVLLRVWINRAVNFLKQLGLRVYAF